MTDLLARLSRRLGDAPFLELAAQLSLSVEIVCEFLLFARKLESGSTTYVGLKLSLRNFLITCFSGQSSSL